MSKALDRFREQQKLADQLVTICESDVGGKHDALSRAGVVFCVASWQGYVVNVIVEAHEEIRLKIQSLNSNEVIFFIHDFCEINKELLEDKIKYFNTPNSENVTKLFKTTLAFDSNVLWNSDNLVKSEKKPMEVTLTIKARMDMWLRVRHSIAHGFELPTDIRRQPEKDLNLDHESLVECVGFFTFLATQTDMELNSYLKKKFDINLEKTNYVSAKNGKP